MPILGFSFAPWGTSIFGYGSVAKAEVDKTPIYNKADGSAGTARFIDPYTKDYVLTDKGRFLGADEVEQQVYLALVTAKGSSILSTLGQTFTAIQVVSDNLQKRVEGEVELALSDLVQAELIEIVAVTIEVVGNRNAVKVEWRDVSSDSLKVTEI